MSVLKTRSGKEYESDYVATIQNPHQAYIRIFAPIEYVAAVFSNKEETAQIWYGDIYLAGYTHLVAIVPEVDAIKVCLARE